MLQFFVFSDASEEQQKKPVDRARGAAEDDDRPGDGEHLDRRAPDAALGLVFERGRGDGVGEARDRHQRARPGELCQLVVELEAGKKSGEEDQRNGDREQTVLWDIHEDTKDVIDQMLWPSDLAFTPDGERVFFTAYSQETGKRELYWIRNGGILPVKMSQDDWWADFSVPFGFVEMADQSFSDGSKAYVVLLLVNDHWNAGEIACVYMDNRNYYTILSHENTLLRDSLSHSVMVGKNELTTFDGTVVHYVDYTNLSQNAAGQPAERPVHIMYADVQNSSCVAWNETAIKNTLAGEKVYIVSENDFRSRQDKEEFEYFINETFK